VETLDGQLIGEIEVLNISWRLHSAELRVFIGQKSLWDKGLGTDTVSTFVKEIFRTTRLQEIFLRVAEENHRAKKCYKKAGFKVKGRVRFSPERNIPSRLVLMEITRDDVEELRDCASP